MTLGFGKAPGTTVLYCTSWALPTLYPGVLKSGRLHDQGKSRDWVRITEVTMKGWKAVRTPKPSLRKTSSLCDGTFGSGFWGFLPAARSYVSAATADAIIQIKDTAVLRTATEQLEFKKS